MAGNRFRGVVGFLVAGSMCVVSTAAAAETSLAVPQRISPWATLTVLSGGAPAAAVCGATAIAATAQAPATPCVLPVVDTAPPVAQNPPPAPVPIPPVEGPAAGFSIDPIYLALAAIAAGVGIYFLVRKHQANSPA